MRTAYDHVAAAYDHAFRRELAQKRLDRALLAVLVELAGQGRVAAWAGVVAFYSIVHLTGGKHTRTCREVARVLSPGGWALIAFHVDGDTFAAGDVNHLRHWFGQDVELDGHFLDPDTIVDQLQHAVLVVHANVRRQPYPEVEYPSRRCYLLAQRPHHQDDSEE